MAMFPFTNDPSSQVEMIYIAYFGRAGDPQGVNFWVNELAAGGDTIVPGMTGVAAAFSQQPEAIAQYPLLANPEGASQADIQAFINAIYQNLFDRSADAKGLAFWTNEVNAIIDTGDSLQIANGIGQMAISIALGAQGTDQTVLENKVTASDFLTQTFAQDGINTFPNPSQEFTFAHTDIAGVDATQASVTAAETAATGFDTTTTHNLTAAAGTVDMALLPATITTINYQTPATGSVTIINQSKPLTVNLEDNTTDQQTLTVSGAAGLNDSLVISLGNPSHNAGDSIAAIDVTGDELVTIKALGATDFTGPITLTPTLAGNEQVTLSGNTQVFTEIADATVGVLNIDNMSITVTNTGLTSLIGAPSGSILNFVTDAGANGIKLAPSIGYSTNAAMIDASASGGLFMSGGDANFNPATSAGDVIIGAANPLGFHFVPPIGDVLVGSIGNDTITSKSLVLPDYIFTDGGADKITLAPGHTGADHIGFYALTSFESVNAISEGISAGGGPETDYVNPGWWGISAGGSSTQIATGLFGVATGTGTSADNSTLTGYVPDQDVLAFSAGAWSTALGLTADQADVLVNVGTAGLAQATAVSAAQVAPGGTISGAGTVDFIVLSQDSFLNAAAVAGALSGGSYTIHHSLLAEGAEANFLVAYAGQDGNAHIADLHLSGGAGGSTMTASGTTASDTGVYASDMVTLVGINITQLAANTGELLLVA